MNERIEKLAVEARQYAFGEVENSQDPTEWSTKYYNEMFEQKFAELIVRECLAHGKLTQSQTVVNGSEEYNAGREMGIEVFMNQIKLHFGVEE